VTPSDTKMEVLDRSFEKRTRRDLTKIRERDKRLSKEINSDNSEVSE